MQRMNLTRMIASTFGLDESMAFIIVAVLAVMVFLCVAVPSLMQWIKKTDDADKKRTVRKWFIAAAIILIAVLSWLAVSRVIPLNRAQKAMEEGNYQLAVDLYDNLDMLSEEIDARKHLGEKAAAEGDYETAIRIFDGLNVQERVRQLKIEKIMLDLKKGEDQQAMNALAQMLYQPEAARALLQAPELYKAMFVPGREMLLDSEWSALSWYIAAVEDEKALLVYTGLDRDIFHTEPVLSWKSSYLRQALQTYFQEELTEDVRDAVILTKLQNIDSDGYQLSAGETTEDGLFILSKEESQQYLPSLTGVLNGKRFWTRTPMEGEHCGMYAAMLNQLEDGTDEVSFIDSAWTVKEDVFPAMWVDMNQLLHNWAEE